MTPETIAYSKAVAKAIEQTTGIVYQSQREDFWCWATENILHDTISIETYAESIIDQVDRAEIIEDDIPITRLPFQEVREFYAAQNEVHGAFFMMAMHHNHGYMGVYRELEVWLIIPEWMESTRLKYKTIPVSATPHSYATWQEHGDFSHWWRPVDWLDQFSFVHLDDAHTMLPPDAWPAAYAVCDIILGHKLEWNCYHGGLTTDPPALIYARSTDGHLGMYPTEYLTLHGAQQMFVWDSLQNTYIEKDDAIVLKVPGCNQNIGPFTSKWNNDVEEVWLQGEPTDRYVYAPQGIEE